MRTRSGVLRGVVLLAVLLVSILVAAAVGSVAISPVNVGRMLLSRILGFDSIERTWTAAEELIVMQVRLPRVLLAAVIGGGLSAAGVLFQGILRNPLADPYIIGVSSGASLGAAAALLFFIPAGLGWYGTLPLYAFAGAVGATFIVYRVGLMHGRLHPTNLILAGVAVGALFTAMVSFMMVFKIQNLQDVYMWLMGSLSGRGWRQLGAAAPYVLAGSAVAVLFAPKLDVYLLGEETAHSLGIDVQRLQKQVLAIGALIAAACVAVSGVIGFVGLMVPHAVRIWIGPKHTRLTVYAFLAGAIFLVVADTLARTVFSPIELPVGIVTAMTGGPFFIYLMRRS
ncbi:MAG: FecCD family ABC transporter permease [Limnochordia bacterium]|jgi:iron complex transport system permease protein